MKTALSIASLLTVASAFAPTPSSQRLTTKLSEGLWNEPPKESEKEMSKALPFVARPKILDGTLPGDVGFDPFGFAGSEKANLMYMREAEIKHCRLAMLAVLGWPLAELYDKPIADAAGLPTALTRSGESPSILNGGLDKIDVLYWGAIVALAGVIELENSKMVEEKGKNYVAGDCGLSSLLPSDKEAAFNLQTKEIKNGRLAMMAILGFVVQEALYGKPVVEQTPFFFHPAEWLF